MRTTDWTRRPSRRCASTDSAQPCSRDIRLRCRSSSTWTSTCTETHATYNCEGEPITAPLLLFQEPSLDFGSAGILLGGDFARRFGHMLRASEIAPAIRIGAEGADAFPFPGHSQIRGDDGEGAVFCEL